MHGYLHAKNSALALLIGASPAGLVRPISRARRASCSTAIAISSKCSGDTADVVVGRANGRSAIPGEAKTVEAIGELARQFETITSAARCTSFSVSAIMDAFRAART
jgi:hypothetical protein